MFATKGARIYIGPAMEPTIDDFVLADFESASPALPWVEIDLPENMGTIGDSAEAVNFDAINRGRRMKGKGVNDAGNQALVFGIKSDDPGQQALRAAQLTPSNYAFKIEFNDAPEGGDPSIRYYVGLVMSASDQLDTANNVMKLLATIGINSNVVVKNAAA